MVGFAWDHCDDDKMRDTFGVGQEVFGQLIDVQDVARRLGYVRTGLANLAKTILRYSLTKDKWVTRSNWDARFLSCNQLRYAAMDAVVTAALYRALRSLHDSPISCETCGELVGVQPAQLVHMYGDFAWEVVVFCVCVVLACMFWGYCCFPIAVCKTVCVAGNAAVYMTVSMIDACCPPPFQGSYM